MRIMKSAAAGLAALSLVAGLLPAGLQAAPVSPGTSPIEVGTLVGKAHGRHHHHGGGAAAILGGIVAGAIIAGAVREGRAREEDIDRCAYEFRSFDPRSGTYINRYGDEVVCPYLR